MGKDQRDQPSGTNKSAEPSRVPNNITPGEMTRNEQMTEKHTINDENIQGNIREMYPNRNSGKGNANER